MTYDELIEEIGMKTIDECEFGSIDEHINWITDKDEDSDCEKAYAVQKVDYRHGDNKEVYKEPF